MTTEYHQIRLAGYNGTSGRVEIFGKWDLGLEYYAPICINNF